MTVLWSGLFSDLEGLYISEIAIISLVPGILRCTMILEKDTFVTSVILGLSDSLYSTPKASSSSIPLEVLKLLTIAIQVNMWCFIFVSTFLNPSVLDKY